MRAAGLPERQIPLPVMADGISRRDLLITRWMTLVRDILPAMAQRCHWPISRDHCFMRVCLDTALGAPWPSVVRRPAVRNLSDAQLGAAITIAEDLVRAPETLAALNRQSIRWRRDAINLNRRVEHPAKEPAEIPESRELMLFRNHE